MQVITDNDEALTHVEELTGERWATFVHMLDLGACALRVENGVTEKALEAEDTSYYACTFVCAYDDCSVVEGYVRENLSTLTKKCGGRVTLLRPGIKYFIQEGFPVVNEVECCDKVMC